MLITDDNMKELNLKLGTRLKIMALIKNLQPSTSQTSNLEFISEAKSSNDNENTIEIHPGVAIEVLDMFNKQKFYPRVGVNI